MIADIYLAQNEVNIHDLRASPPGLRRLALGESCGANGSRYRTWLSASKRLRLTFPAAGSRAPHARHGRAPRPRAAAARRGPDPAAGTGRRHQPGQVARAAAQAALTMDSQLPADGTSAWLA